MPKYRMLSWNPAVVATIAALAEYQLSVWAADDEAALELAGIEIRNDLAAGRPVAGARDYRTRPGNGGVRNALLVKDGRPLADTATGGRRPEPGVGQRPLALLLPGQGAQYPRMAAGLYECEPTFTAVLDRLFSAMGSSGDRLREAWLGCGRDSARADSEIDHVSVAQPLLFAIEYALTSMVQSWQVQVTAFLGHSIGEMAAAVSTGVFDERAAIALIDDRVRALAMAPPGGMLAVVASADEVRAILPSGTSIAAVNGPRQVLVAGFDHALAEAELALRTSRITFRRARASTPFHHPGLRAALSTVQVRTDRCGKPDRRLVSCYTGQDLDLDTVRDPSYWHSHPYSPVLFADALDSLLASRCYQLLEVGPSQGLSALARLHPAVRAGRSGVISLQPAQGADAAAERRAVLNAMAALWRQGNLDLFGAGQD